MIADSFRQLATDRGLEPILRQLHDHLESIHNNTAPVTELDTAITRSRAALDVYNHRSLDPEKAKAIYQLVQ